MSLVGNLLFCQDCGNLLERAATKLIHCHVCDARNENKWPSVVKTASKPDAFPSSLRHKRNEIQTIIAGDVETWARTAKVCPACKNPEMLFKDVQLRGADEGTTIFYRCPNCQERSKEDN